jgi:hypothetical protein
MEKALKLDLIERALGLKHKLKVHDSMPQPDSHEQLARSTYARWELEDELQAIEDILKDARAQNVQKKKETIAANGVHKKKSEDF